MKDNLQHFTQENEESRIQFQQLAEKYKTIFYKAPLPKWIYETKTLKFLEVNEAAVQHYGYSQDEFLNMTIKDIRPKEEEEKFINHLNKVSSGTDTTKSTWRHVKKNGKVITVEVTAHPIKYNDEVARLVVINDITERIKAEKSLRQHEETNRLIMSSSLDAIICMDIFGKITFWNPQAETIFGWKSRDIEGKHLADTIIPPQYREQHRKGLTNFLITGEGPVLNRIIEISAMNKEGSEFPIELAIIPIHQDDTTFFCGFIRDITERKKAEEQLSGERNLLRSLIDNLPDYIYVKDKETHYIINNKAFVKLVGAESENETTGKKVTDLFEEEVGRINMEEDKKVLTLGTVIIDRDEPIVTYKGEKRWLLTTKVPLKDKEEKVVGILGISKDITERKLAEQELRQSREDLRLLAAHLEQVREDERITIAREIHDELGQQLTVLKMDVSWLHKNLPDSNKKAKEKTQHLLNMLENTVKTVRKISSELRPSMLDDLGLLAALEWQSQEFSKRSGIKTIFSSAIGNLYFSQNIATGIFRIFQESLTNVARHADATRVKASLQMKNGNIVLQIEDNGKGFTIASIENNKTLGILGMRERTLMMGGEYKITSTPGKGTIVEVIVPTGYSN
jgi:two-component system sensor histidine kinase UhpB